jgi:hypothetical protein
MQASRIPDNFCLYLWRSHNSPGTLYLAKGLETAEALCRGLTEHGYIVKVIHMATNTELELREGRLCPAAQGYPPLDPSSRSARLDGGINSAFA